jgi:hypothetical protein
MGGDDLDAGERFGRHRAIPDFPELEPPLRMII